MMALRQGPKPPSSQPGKVARATRRKERRRMKIEIIGEPKEIAALVLAVQERQSQSNLARKRVIEDSGEADYAMTARCSAESIR